MTKRRGSKKLPVDMPNRDPRLVERDLLMFKDWMSGLSMGKVAEKHGMAYDTVRDIAAKYSWKSLRRELLARRFSHMLDEMTSFSADILGVLYADFKGIIKSAKDEKRSLTSEERGHLRSLWDRMLKEKRLEEGLPTETDTGPVRVELVVPHGVKHVGVIPVPKSNITVTNKPAKTVESEDKIDLDAIEEDHNE